MKKNYNYNYVNRTTVKKAAVEYGNVEVASCTSANLKKSAISNGTVWHTTDTNEFYYDWDGKRTKLNLTGDSASMIAEINKIKSDVAKLNPEAIESKINAATNKAQNAVTRAEAAVASVNNIKSEVDDAKEQADAASQAAQNAASQVADKVNASDLADVATSGSYNDLSDTPNLSNYATKNEIPSVEGLASESWVEGKGYLTSHQDLSNYATKSEIPDVSNLATKSEIPDVSGKADKTELPRKVSDLTNDAGYLKEEDLPDFLTDSDLPDVTEGSFPAGVNVESPSAAADGLATVQDVMDYVRAYFEKKKDELEPDSSEVPVVIPYLYTNGYKIGDTPIELTDPFNAYEIVLDENGEFVIELLHKDELDGYFDPEGDPADNEPGQYFKVILPTGYNMTVYSWNPEASGDDKYELASVNDPGSNLVAYDVTPDNTTYYYSVVAIKYLWGGGKGVESSINTYGHLLKLVITKNN